MSPDEDVEVDSDESEEGAREVDLPLHVDRHVHPDQAFVGQQVRAFAPETQGWVDLLQEGKHVHVMNLAPEKKRIVI